MTQNGGAEPAEKMPVPRPRVILRKNISVLIYQIPMTCCIPRLVREIPIQQQRPMKIGFPPDLTSFTISVLRPIAAIAITIKNLLTCFISEKNPRITVAAVPAMIPAEIMYWNTVVMTDAPTK